MLGSARTDDPRTTINQELEKRGWTRNEFARQLGITSGAVSKIMNGTHTPSRAVASKIEQLLGVMVSSWDGSAAS